MIEGSGQQDQLTPSICGFIYIYCKILGMFTSIGGSPEIVSGSVLFSAALIVLAKTSHFYSLISIYPFLCLSSFTS